MYRLAQTWIIAFMWSVINQHWQCTVTDVHLRRHVASAVVRSLSCTKCPNVWLISDHRNASKRIFASLNMESVHINESLCSLILYHTDKQSTNSLILNHTTTNTILCDTYITELIDLLHLRYWSRRYVLHTFIDVNITQFMQHSLHDTDHTKQVLYIPWLWSHTNKGQCSMILYHRNNAL